MSRYGRCTKCGAKILWIKTPTGKNMPCDPDLIPYWQNSKGKKHIVTPNGEVIACQLEGDAQTATGLGYVPHWGTCPCAKEFKR